MIRKTIMLSLLFCATSIFAQDDLVNKVINNASINSKFHFKDMIDIENTSIKNQGSAGTCWSYSGNSFLESEMIRLGKAPVDLAEIYTARQVYLSKARNYILMNGNMSLGDGGEPHDVVNMIKKYGAMPQEAYTNEDYGKGSLKSAAFQKDFKAILDNYMKNPDSKKGVSWVKDINDYLDKTLGKVPATFTYLGKNYTPHTFAKEVVGIVPEQYVEITSYMDSPYYEKILVPVPDNWSYDMAYNIPMTEMTDVIDAALKNGFSVAWSTDVSEDYFSWKNGVAHVPNVDLYNITDSDRKKFFDKPVQEKVITEEMRLAGLYSLYTTDDHAMQIVGIAKDQGGKEYYKIKNSWGDKNDYKGYLYVSKAFVHLKTTSIYLHQDALTKNFKSKLKA